MRPSRSASRAVLVVGALAFGFVGTACSSSSSSGPGTEAAVAGASADATERSTEAVPGSEATTVAAAVSADASQEISVVFDTPGADPRPLRETAVVIGAPTPALRMRVTDLTYRGVVCGFTFAGTRPAAPVSIRVDGTTSAGSFTSGPVELRWNDDGTTSADSPSSDNGWSFSADAYPSRNGPGWAVSIGAVTAEGNPDPTGVTCELRSGVKFVPENGPVGFWAGFATV